MGCVRRCRGESPLPDPRKRQESRKNVVTTAITTAGLEGHCIGTGGTKFQVEGSATKEYVCNGEEGEPGAIHPGETLPSEATENGAFAFRVKEPLNGLAETTLSFPVPLENEIAESNVHVETQEFPAQNQTKCEAKPEPEKAACLAALKVQEEDCPGTATAPKAKAGHLCVYIGVAQGPGALEFELFLPETLNETGIAGASRSGASLMYSGSANETIVRGSWAVTAP